MKKLIFITFVLLMNMLLVKADVLPDYRANEKIVKGINRINVADFPDWKFYQYVDVFVMGPSYFEEIPASGDLGCRNIYFRYGYRIWAIRKDLADAIPVHMEAEERVENEHYSRPDDILNAEFLERMERFMEEKWAISLFSGESLEGNLIGCNIVVDRRFRGDEQINLITLSPDMLRYHVSNSGSELEQSDGFELTDSGSETELFAGFELADGELDAAEPYGLLVVDGELDEMEVDDVAVDEELPEDGEFDNEVTDSSPRGFWAKIWASISCFFRSIFNKSC